jgi:hypothetical protein
VANHPVARLADATRYQRWSAFASREERIVAYADKRCGQRLESMADRFAEWERRFPPRDAVAGDDRRLAQVAHAASADGASWDRATFERVRQRAARLEADVCRAAGIHPADVRRLTWTGRALAKAAT